MLALPLEVIPISYMLISYNQKNNMADARTSEVGATLAPLNTGS
jgi:hypothetical protein